MKWEHRMLQIAALTATWSKDPSTQVGAVIADSSNRIVSQGYNGLPRGAVDREMSRGEKLRRTIHAEVNAVLFGGRAVAACTLYCTHHPCARCASVIAQAGIWRVVCYDRPLRPDWAEDIASARDTFAEAGMPLVIVPAPETPQSIWRDVCERSRAIVLPASQQKSLVISEHDCVRVGASLGL